MEMQKRRNIIKAITILFVFITIYFVGVFNSRLGGELGVYPCQHSPMEFNCTDPILYMNGTISFLFSQRTGATLYNVHFACALFTNNYNAHPIANADQYYDLLNVSSGLRNDSLANKERISITNLQCYGPNGSRLNSRPSSVPYGGYVWINYTTNANTPSANNPWISSMVTQI